MTHVDTLQPTALWRHFTNLNAVPRPSKKEERVIEFMVNFGKGLGLSTTSDEVGNVIIKKPATPGFENRKTIVLQSHLDMVHQKNADTRFNFDEEGIRMLIDDDWVKAEGTTLGADNGIGVAAIMGLLSSDDLPHPPLEALFTIDEETGMTGANALKGGLLEGSILLNLDTEDDRELTIGCAGGIDVTASGSYAEEKMPEGYTSFELRLKGLTGGHSGMDIHLGRGNSNKLMNRILKNLIENLDARICKIDGGGLRNAIPRESSALIAIPNEQNKDLESTVNEFEKILQAEYKSTDPELKLVMQETNERPGVMEKSFSGSFINAIYACQVGIYRMSPEMKDLVQTSNNLARVEAADGKYSIQCLTRSSVDSEKLDLSEALKSTFQLIGANVEFSGSYPGWTPDPGAKIVDIMADLYRKKFKDEPLINACHAGLECGILGQNYPDMEMISFGPNIRGAHSPDEKVQISSVQKFWNLLLDTLQEIPER